MSKKPRSGKPKGRARVLADVTAKPRGPGKPFQAGQSGNPAGRPLGARSRLSEAFLAAFFEAWEKHGAEALLWVAKNDQSTFVRAAAALVPKHVDVAVNSPLYIIADRPLTDQEWEAKFCETRVLQPPESKPKTEGTTMTLEDTKVAEAIAELGDGAPIVAPLDIAEQPRPGKRLMVDVPCAAIGAGG